tara:strand:- start:292 stop:558 length:267 start_codon:yes stop_codon:yes gene_type:complete
MVKNGYKSHRGRSAIARSTMTGTYSDRFTNRPQGGGSQTKGGSAPTATGFNTLYYRISQSKVFKDPTNYQFKTSFNMSSVSGRRYNYN